MLPGGLASYPTLYQGKDEGKRKKGRGRGRGIPARENSHSSEKGFIEGTQKNQRR
jgi:hypothetical protein